MAALVACFLYFFVVTVLAVLKGIIDKLSKSTDIIEQAVLSVVFLLNVGIPVAIVVGPMLFNWDKHPLSSVVYGSTFLALFLYRPRNVVTKPQNKVE